MKKSNKEFMDDFMKFKTEWEIDCDLMSNKSTMISSSPAKSAVKAPSVKKTVKEVASKTK